ncbi:MAG: hypothetical protein FWD79_06230 [Desulfobulbus sp.]|nr:hypothetical protein [Desulfobulbus sp.]
MKGARFILAKKRTDEEEKPFWISFADLMTALMVLFLVAMAVALLAVTKTASEREQKEAAHRQDIKQVMERFAEAAEKFEGIHVNVDEAKERCVIYFDKELLFSDNSCNLTKDQERELRVFVPEMLDRANRDAVGKRVIKRFVLEGYTDNNGSYLFNVNLSLLRSQRVLCALFATTGTELLSDEQKKEVRDLFLVGGYSFNAAKSTEEESRRVEMRVEFLGIDEKRPEPPKSDKFGECVILTECKSRKKSHQSRDEGN